MTVLSSLNVLGGDEESKLLEMIKSEINYDKNDYDGEHPRQEMVLLRKTPVAIEKIRTIRFAENLEQYMVPSQRIRVFLGKHKEKYVKSRAEDVGRIL